MREDGKSSRDRKRAASISYWGWWHYLSTSDWASKLLASHSIHGNGWSDRYDDPFVNSTWLAYKCTVASASITAFAIGLRECILKLWGF